EGTQLRPHDADNLDAITTRQDDLSPYDSRVGTELTLPQRVTQDHDVGRGVGPGLVRGLRCPVWDRDVVISTREATTERRHGTEHVEVAFTDGEAPHQFRLNRVDDRQWCKSAGRDPIDRCHSACDLQEARR